LNSPRPAQLALPAPHHPTPHEFFLFCAIRGCDFHNPQGCGAGAKRAEIEPVPPHAHPYPRHAWLNELTLGLGMYEFSGLNLDETPVFYFRK